MEWHSLINTLNISYFWLCGKILGEKEEKAMRQLGNHDNSSKKNYYDLGQSGY